jgi:alkaline phosphatase D
MLPFSRRRFITGACATAVAVAATACSDGASVDDDSASSTTEPGGEPATAPATTIPATSVAVPDTDLASDPFTLGVASGDPDAASVVLWTRLAPEPLSGGGMSASAADVLWEVSADDSFDEIAASGIATAVADHGHSLHVVVALGAGEWFYRFRVGPYTSAIGRTLIAPGPEQSVEEVRIAAASCQNYSNGYYAAHRDIAEQRPDLVVFLGDYIYESAGADGADPAERVHLGPEPTDIATYRNRYARYKTDSQLQAAHAVCPWLVIWDDHEVDNNYAGDESQDGDDPAAFRARRSAAYKAWWEHQPVRLDPPADASADGGGEYRIYRSIIWGDLMQVALLDGRQYRDDQACGDVALNLAPACAEAADPERTMLGDTQEAWLLDTLRASAATWNAVANQVVLADARLNDAVLNYDQWDGYPAARARLLHALAKSAIDNLIVLTGDIHLAAVAQLHDGDPATGTAVGVEFVSTSISSAGLVGDTFTEVLKSFPELVDAELAHRGYVLHTVTHDHWSAEYRIVADVADPDSDVTTFSTYEVQAGSSRVST